VVGLGPWGFWDGWRKAFALARECPRLRIETWGTLPHLHLATQPFTAG